MEEAQRLADRVGVLAHGRLVALGTPTELAERQLGGFSVIGFRLPEGLHVTDLPEVGERFTWSGPLVEVRTRRPDRDVHTLTGWALDRGVALGALTVGRPSLEDAYLDLVREPEPSDD
jgi:ABC-2 type transport system ATP-binding protein